MEAKYRSIVWRFYALEFFSGFHFFSAVLTPMFADWAGYGLERGILVAQVLQSWFALCVFLLEVPTGVVADRFGRKHSLMLGKLILVPATLIYGAIPDIGVFALGEFLFACGMALTSGADKALLYDWMKALGKEDQATEVWGRSRSISMIGMLVAAPIGGLIAGTLGLNYPMLLTSIPVLFTVLIAWSIPEPKVEKREEDSSLNHIQFALVGMKYLRNHKILLRWTLNSVIVGTAAYFVIWLYQPLMKTLGFPIEWFGFVHTGFVMVEILISANFGGLIILFRSVKRLLAFSALATSLAFILVALYPTAITFTLFLIFAGGFGYTRAELMGITMNRYIESHNRATVNSAISMFRQLARAFANILVGFGASYSLSLTLFVIGLIALLSFLFPLNGEEEKKKE
jgi:MFS family permease